MQHHRPPDAGRLVGLRHARHIAIASGASYRPFLISRTLSPTVASSVAATISPARYNKYKKQAKRATLLIRIILIYDMICYKF
jgi:hypothetical protein